MYTHPYSDAAVRKFRRLANPTLRCWVWSGWKNRYGYGRIAIDGLELMAHRVSWEIHFGPIPEGMRILHRCDNPPCVRPSHLFLGTAADNTHDMILKGRVARGSKLPQARVTEQQVVEIRQLAGSITQATISRRFGISQASVSRIINRVDWRHIS